MRVEVRERSTKRLIMEGIGTKRLMTVILMLSLVVVQADHSSSFHLAESNLRCGLKCGLKCFLKLKLDPTQDLFCFELCMLLCKSSPADVVYSCTQDCAQSKTDNFKSGMRISHPYSLVASLPLII